VAKAEKERRATWLELFYDLVFAAAVAEIGVSLYANYTTLSSFLGTVALFFPVFWTWLGVTFYSARFETDDFVHRILILLQMAAAAALALNIHGALGETSFNFAISYAAIRGLLVIEYVRAGRRIPAARPFANKYSEGFSITASIWLISAFIPAPERFILWALALGIDVAITIFIGRKHLQLAPNIFYLPERLGLFTLIVLGETIFSLIHSLSGYGWGVESTISMGAGLTIAFSLWWLYFDKIDGSVIRKFRDEAKSGLYITWLYTHFPLVVGLCATAAGIGHLVSADQNMALPYLDELLICGSVALCLFSIGAIHLCISYASGERKPLLQLSLYRFIAGVAIILIPILKLQILPVFLILIVGTICIIQILIDLKHHPHHRISNF
jgi:low temperature requirement protein LtrA